MGGLIGFMRSTAGRVLRVVLGLVLIYVGLALVGGTGGIVLAVVGLLPIALGVWGPCALEFILPKSK